MPEQLKSTTIREFDGGWNIIDNDLNLSFKYATKLVNLQRKMDGSLGTRYGTMFWAELLSTGNVVELAYFQEHIIAFMSDGTIEKVTAAGSSTVIWNTAIAALLPGAPSAWSSTVTFVSYTVMSGKLIACNGVDKPLLIDLGAGSPVTYLQDLATSSNANTPVGRYVMTIGRFLVIAGNSAAPDRLYISHMDASGTFSGDPAPNNATTVDMGNFIHFENQTIKGLARFRDFLVVGFTEGVALVQLGRFNTSTGLSTPTASDTHIPLVSDVIEAHGVIAHRTMISVQNDLLFGSEVGVGSLSQALITNTIHPKRPSDLIDPFISDAVGGYYDNISDSTIGGLTVAESEDEMFAVYDSRQRQYILQIPEYERNTALSRKARVGNKCAAYTFFPQRKIAAWNEYRGWNFSAGVRTLRGEIVFGQSNKLYLYTNTSLSDNTPVLARTQNIDRPYITIDYSLANGTPVTTERLTNGDFATNIASWTVSGPSLTAAWNSDGGVGANQLTKASGGVGAVAYTYQITDTLHPGCRYRVSFKLKLIKAPSKETDADIADAALTAADKEVLTMALWEVTDDGLAVIQNVVKNRHLYKSEDTMLYKLVIKESDLSTTGYTEFAFDFTTLREAVAVAFDMTNSEDTVSVRLDDVSVTLTTPNVENPTLFYGSPLFVDWELPWADFDKRSITKRLKYLSVDAAGYGSFDITMYIDNVRDAGAILDPRTEQSYEDKNYSQLALAPALSMMMTGGVVSGYGITSSLQQFGGGRSTEEERLYSWPAKFKLAKWRFHGQTWGRINFVSVTFSYKFGTVRR